MSGIPIWAVPGAKVVCVNDRWLLNISGCPVCRVPMLTEVLTITACKWCDIKEFPEVLCPSGCFLALAEIPSDQGNWKGVSWPVEHFRPLITRGSEADDVALFRDLLTNPVSVDA